MRSPLCQLNATFALASGHYEMVDLHASRAAAIVTGRNVMGGELGRGVLCLACHIDIVDYKGQHLMRVLFSDAVRVTGHYESF